MSCSGRVKPMWQEMIRLWWKQFGKTQKPSGESRSIRRGSGRAAMRENTVSRASPPFSTDPATPRASTRRMKMWISRTWQTQDRFMCWLCVICWGWSKAVLKQKSLCLNKFTKNNVWWMSNLKEIPSSQAELVHLIDCFACDMYAAAW